MYVTNDLTRGSIGKNLFLFYLPLMIGNVLQQLYNIVDTIIVGKYIGSYALAAVGSSYSLMTFLTSIILGLCMGSGIFFSIEFGKKDMDRLKKAIFMSFILIGIIAILINILVYIFSGQIQNILRVPSSILDMSTSYIRIVFLGILAIFLYNYYACLLRSVGNSIAPIIFLAASTFFNIVLDIFFVVNLNMGIRGVGIATIISQYIAALAIVTYTKKKKIFKIEKCHMVWDWGILKSIANLSFITSLQQSVMNFGILMIQGLVNTFGAVVMAGFTTAVKIDTIAYMPLQDFGNAFSTFVAQNMGAGRDDRIKKGIRISILTIFIFSTSVGIFVTAFSRTLMKLFVDYKDVQVIYVGVSYLKIVALFYIGIGILFWFYGYFRAINMPIVSLILTIVSLGTRVVVAYSISSISHIGVLAIWWAIPLGWILADISGFVIAIKNKPDQMHK